MQCIPHLGLTYMNKDKLTVGAKLLTNKDINNQTNRQEKKERKSEI